MHPTSFRENLKLELKYSGMLVKELAAKTGIKKGTIDGYLRKNGNIPSVCAAVKIARALGVSVEYLLTGTEPASLPHVAAARKEAPRRPPETRILLSIMEDLSAVDRLKLIEIARVLARSYDEHIEK